MEVAYRPSYAFEEVLAAFGDATGAAGASDTMLAQVEKTAQCIAGDDKLQIPEILDQDREQVLAKYSFVGKVPKRSQPAKEAKDEGTPDVGDPEFLRGVLAKEQVWRASEFHWRVLLSRRELDLIRPEEQKTFGRNMTYFYAQSQTMQELLARISVLSLGAGILSLIIGFCIPFLLAPYYPPLYGGKSADSTDNTAAPYYHPTPSTSKSNSTASPTTNPRAGTATPYYPTPSAGSTAASGTTPPSSEPSGASSSVSSQVSGLSSKVETGVPVGFWMTYLAERPWYFVPRMVGSALLAFCVLCGILALGLTSKKPFGLRTSQLILRLLMGPFGKDIPDYDPKWVPPNVASSSGKIRAV
jgi:hypothetical protein